MTNEEDGIISRNEPIDSQTQKQRIVPIEIAETAYLSRFIGPFSPGKYKISYSINIPKEFADEQMRDHNVQNVWYGTVTTNEIPFEIIESPD